MKTQAVILTILLTVFSFSPATTSWAAHHESGSAHAVSTTGVSGYDLVSFQTGEKPLRGNGNHVSVVDGVTYLFVNKKNKKTFDANPEKYLPAYGGYCAYGVAVGKKFVGDPDVWKVVDGKLYLNLDNKIQSIWNEDIDGYIQKADGQWNTIKNTPASEL